MLIEDRYAKDDRGPQRECRLKYVWPRVRTYGRSIDEPDRRLIN